MAEREQRVLKVTSEVLEEEIVIPGTVWLVKTLVRRGVGFPIYQRIPERFDEDDFPIHQNPIIGFSGRDSLPLISDPDEIVQGSFAVSIEEQMLVYNPEGTPVHRLRDSYRWSAPPWSYYVDKDFKGVVREFEQSGYSIKSSLDRFQFLDAVFDKGNFVLGEELTANQIFIPQP